MANGSGIIGRSKTVKSYLGRLLSMRRQLHLGRPLPNLAALFMATSGLITLTWVAQLTWYDITTWGKDIAVIFFGPRTGENISLGIGMRIIHYFIIGLALLLPSSLTVLRRQSKAIKLHPSHLLHVQPRKEKEKKKKKQEPQVKSPEGEEKGSSACLHHFGYLASRPKNTPIPQECLICQKILECIAVENPP